MSYNPNAPPYPPDSKGYPPYPMPQGQGDGMGFAPQASQPPPGYSYPPVPVPYDGHQAITQQPGHGPPGGFYGIIPQPGPGYAPPPYSGGGGFTGYPDTGMYPQPPHNAYTYNQAPPQNYAQPSIQMQPTGYGPPGQTVPLNVPPGLEFLTQLDRLFVKQKVELLEAFLGCETKNKYKVKDSQGRDLYTAKEDTDCCTRQCCGPNRPFELIIKDLNDREVIHLSRPLACGSCCFPCCLQSLEVFAPPGQLAGTVEQEWSLCSPKFVVKDEKGEVVLRIEGPFCTFSICGDVQFDILSRDGGSHVGKISKKWTGLLREAFTDADNFGINFPMDLDVRMKAVMLGACFLIDFMFFEKSANNENDSPGMF